MRSNYTYFIDGNILFIEDIGLRKSVTNDIENVLEDLTKELNTSMFNFRVIYRDSYGRIDQALVNKDGKFRGFYYIGEASYHAAKLKIVENK